MGTGQRLVYRQEPKYVKGAFRGVSIGSVWHSDAISA